MDDVKLQVSIPASLYWELRQEAVRRRMSFRELLVDALWAHRAFDEPAPYSELSELEKKGIRITESTK